MHNFFLKKKRFLWRFELSQINTQSQSTFLNKNKCVLTICTILITMVYYLFRSYLDDDLKVGIYNPCWVCISVTYALSNLGPKSRFWTYQAHSRCFQRIIWRDEFLRPQDVPQDEKPYKEYMNRFLASDKLIDCI